MDSDHSAKIDALLRVIHEQHQQIDELKKQLEGTLSQEKNADRKRWAWFNRRTLKQKAVVIALTQGLSSEEIAQLMDCSDNMVRGHIRTCIKHLGEDCNIKDLRREVQALLEDLTEKMFFTQFGISKDWHQNATPALLSKIRSKESTLVQWHEAKKVTNVTRPSKRNSH